MSAAVAQRYLFQWRKDDAPLRFDETRMTYLPSGALEIDELLPSDRGTYQCNVTAGTFSRLNSKSNLNINAASGMPEQFIAPTFQTIPLPQTVKEGDMVTLDCVANGNPKPAIKWLKNGEEIDMS
jgi:neogenin